MKTMRKKVNLSDPWWAPGDMPVQGHLLPYIPYDRAQDYEVSVHAVNGWIDSFSDSQIQSTSTEKAGTL